MKLHEKIEQLREALAVFAYEPKHEEDMNQYAVGNYDGSITIVQPLTPWRSNNITAEEHVDYFLKRTKTLADGVKALEERDGE
jgi:hypothetical protein